jgi:molecular chaperone DnaK (HSP70)
LEKSIVLAGGSVKIHKIKEIISEFFNKEKIKSYIDPDELTVRGAAYWAYSLKKYVEYLLP